MSLVFNDTSTYKGIIQKIERLVYGNDAVGRITGNTTLFKQWTAEVNCAMDRAFHIIFMADGRWQFDDSNHTDYPIIATNLVANQRDYSFTTDGNSNLILDIHKVLIADDSGLYHEAERVDVQSEDAMDAFWDGQNVAGQPYRYDKTANGIFLDPVPSYNETSGLKIYISREGSYFTTSDTTKKAGFAGLYHEYLAVYPAWQYAQANSLANQNALYQNVLALEKSITEHYSRRQKDERHVMTHKKINYV